MDRFDLSRGAGILQRQRTQNPWPRDRDFRILSIDGGGIKGLLPISLLALLEERYAGDLKEWTVLVGHCTFCGHKAELDPRKDRGVYPTRLLVYIRNRLTCSNCGKRGGCKLLVRKLPR